MDQLKHLKVWVYVKQTAKCKVTKGIHYHCHCFLVWKRLQLCVSQNWEIPFWTRSPPIVLAGVTKTFLLAEL